MKKLLITLALLISAVSFGQTAEEYFNSGSDKHNLKDYNGAISDYNKAIEINPNLAVAYYNRAISKYFTNDLTGACEDAKKSASLGNDASKVIEMVCK